MTDRPRGESDDGRERRDREPDGGDQEHRPDAVGRLAGPDRPEFPNRKTSLTLEDVTDRMDAVRARLGLPWEPMQQCRVLALTSPQAALDSVDRYDSPKERVGAALGVGVAAAETRDEAGIQAAAERFAHERTDAVKKQVDQIVESTSADVNAFEPGIDIEKVEEVAQTLHGLVGGSERELETMYHGWRLSLADPVHGVDWADESEPAVRTAALVGATLGCAEIAGTMRWQYGPADGLTREYFDAMGYALDLLKEGQRELARSLPAEIWADLRLDQR